MKSGNKAFIVIAVLLIVVQLVSFCGMSRMYVGLYPDGDDLLYPSYTSRSGLNIKKALYAITAGFDRFETGFTDLTYGDEFRVMTAEQMASAMVRDSLGAGSNKTFGLFIYDAILTISYWFVGIVGATLLVISLAVKRKAEGTNYKPYPEDNKADDTQSDPNEPS